MTLKNTILLVLLVQYSWTAIIITPPYEGTLVYENGQDLVGYLPCIMHPTADSGKIFWSRANGGTIYSGAGGSLVGEKYSVDANAATTGNYSLVIKNLNRNDSDTYRCQYSADETLIGVILVAGIY